MPVALPVDHNVAKELWLNGFSVNAISKKLGVKPTTLCAWRKRERWDCQPRVQHKSEASGIQAVAERLSAQTLRIIETTLCKLENSPPNSIKDCKEVATAVAAAYATGRKALGLDDAGSGSGRVNVTVYQGSVLVSSEPDRKAIDVTCEPSENQAQVVDNVQVNPEQTLIDIVRKPTQDVE